MQMKRILLAASSGCSSSTRVYAHLDRPDHAFYLKPLTRQITNVWFSEQPVGHNKLQKTVARLCKAAEITGFKTNHSLRATTATRLFHHNVDEQLIMQRTGHTSIDGVRSYKRPCMKQQQRISQLLNSGSERETSSLHSLSLLPNHHEHVEIQSSVKDGASINQPMSLDSLIFNPCSSITININTK